MIVQQTVPYDPKKQYGTVVFRENKNAKDLSRRSDGSVRETTVAN